MSGLEVIGIVASIVQIADLGARISVQLCSVYRTVKDANDSMQSLSSDVSLTCSVLHELAGALKQDSETQLCSPTAFETTAEILKECKAIFDKIDDEIKRDQATEKNPILRGAQKLTLAFQGPNLDLLKSNLERLKSTMLLMLNVTMYAGQIRKRALKSTISNQRFVVQHLLEDKNNEDAKFDKLSQSTRKKAPVDEPVQESVRSLDLEQSNGSGLSKEDHHTPKTAEIKESTKESFRSISTNQNNIAKRDTPTLKITSRERVALQKTTRALDRTEYPAIEISPAIEIEEYCSLLRRLLSDIDACYDSLEPNRLLRMRNGVANLHSMETSLFQHTHPESETRCLHDPFFKCRDTCLVGSGHSRPPVSASVSNTGNAKSTNPDKDCHAGNSRPTCVSRISEEEHRNSIEEPTNASQSSDAGGRTVVRLLNWARAAFASKAHSQFEKSAFKRAQRSTYPTTPGEAFKSPYLESHRARYVYSPILDARSTTASFGDDKGPSRRANRRGSTDSSTESQIFVSSDGDHPQQGVKYHSEVPIPTDINHPPLIATNEMNKTVEDLVLQWTTVTREEMEAENDMT